MHDTHDHRRWGSLAADVTDTEEQFFVADVIVIQVSAHLTGRYQRPEDIHIGMLYKAVG